jgi:hypothetical protein
MNFKHTVVAIALLFAITACSTRSSSKIATPITGPKWEGPVFVSQEKIPEGIEHKVIGTVQADTRTGYTSVESLYPLIAKEAKKINANAVFNTKGGRKVTAFSWSAAYVSGIAVKIKDKDFEKLKNLPGSYH